jgi:hypothetical protein
VARSTIRAAVARTLPVAVLLAAGSCGGEDGISPNEPVLVNRVPMLITSARGGNVDIYVMNADGTGPVRLTTSAAPDVLDSWQR